MTFDESKVKRDDYGRFAENWAARLADQLTAGRQRGTVSASYLPDTSRPGTSAPRAQQLGYVRVGDHPQRMGTPGGADSYFGTSTHPAAGGVWVDPARPGTQVAPRFLNDWGSAMAQIVPPKARSQQRKEAVQDRRREDGTSTPEGRERRGASEGGKVGRRLEGAPTAAVKEMRRAQARTRAETGRRGTRRTPRGTQVESWMDKVNDRIEKGRRG